MLRDARRVAGGRTGRMTGEPLVWHGWVIEVNGGTFTADLRRDGRPDICADFSMSQCGLDGIEAGDLIIVTPDSVKRLELPPWTQEEIDDINKRAQEWLARIMGCFG